jgi:hypothetical protein
MSKFKVGDVVVVNDKFAGMQRVMGHVGVVTNIEEGVSHPYQLRFLVDHNPSLDDYCFAAQELSLVDDLVNGRLKEGDKILITDTFVVSDIYSDGSFNAKLGGSSYRYPFNDATSFEVVVD